MTIPAEMQTEENRISTDFSRFVNIKYANKGRKIIYRPMRIILSRKPEQAKQCKTPTLSRHQSPLEMKGFPSFRACLTITS